MIRPISTAAAAAEFAAEWAAAWNRRDLEAVLAHFHDDVVFTSPTALAVVGTATVRGKQALRDYWTIAMGRITALRFTVDRALWDSQARELAIVYVADIEGKSRRVSENLVFDEAGLVVAAEVFHGVPL
jgi:ketosteroid isomerase-like protein